MSVGEGGIVCMYEMAAYEYRVRRSRNGACTLPDTSTLMLSRDFGQQLTEKISCSPNE